MIHYSNITLDPRPLETPRPEYLIPTDPQSWLESAGETPQAGQVFDFLVNMPPRLRTELPLYGAGTMKFEVRPCGMYTDQGGNPYLEFTVGRYPEKYIRKIIFPQAVESP